MKRIVILSFLALFVVAGVAMAEMAPVQVGAGSMQIGMLFQPIITGYVGDETAIWDDSKDVKMLRAFPRDARAEFSIQRARLILKGDFIEKKISYFFQADFAGKLAFASNKKFLNDATLEQADDLKVTYTNKPDYVSGTANYAPQLMDLKVSFNYIPYTSISIGRYLPLFTYFAPASSAKLLLIDYPLMNQFTGVLRQTGASINFNTKYVQVDVGVWNGRYYRFRNPDIATIDKDKTAVNGLKPTDPSDLNPIWGPCYKTVGNSANAFGDENTAKDISAYIMVTPIDPLQIFGDFWYGVPKEYVEYDKGDKKFHNDTVYMASGGAAYRPDFGLIVIAEALWANIKYDEKYYKSPVTEKEKNVVEYNKKNDAYPSAYWYTRGKGLPDKSDFTNVSAFSVYGMAGFNLKTTTGVPVEFLVRYDYLNPDMSDKKLQYDPSDPTKILDTSKDAVSYLTGGVNYYFKDWTVLMLNYVHKSEQYKYGVRDLTSMKTKTGLDDDEVKLQAQVSF